MITLITEIQSGVCTLGLCSYTEVHITLCTFGLEAHLCLRGFPWGVLHRMQLQW